VLEREASVAREVVGVRVGLEHAHDPDAAALRLLEIRLDRVGGINDDGLPGRLVADQVGRAAEVVVHELPKKHFRTNLPAHAAGFFEVRSLVPSGLLRERRELNGGTAAGGQATPANARLTNDDPALPGAGYVSDYTLVTGNPYTDDVLTTCSQSRGRQNEPAVAVDPRNTDVIGASSNDYCPVFNADGTFPGRRDI